MVFLYQGRSMAGNMTANIYGYRQTCNMGRSFFNIYSKSGNCSAESLRAYAESVYFVEHFVFKVCVKRFAVSDRNVTAESFFCQICTVFKIPAYTDSDNYRRAWVAAGFCDTVGYETDYIVMRGRRSKHFKGRHIFTAESFWTYIYLNIFAVNYFSMDYRRSIIAGIDTFKRVAYYGTS